MPPHLPERFGLSQPEGTGQVSPFGDTARAAVSHLKAGFGISFVGARPGKGVLMHTHDSVECFLVISGKWKLEYELDVGNHYTILEPLDFIACPIGLERRFECLESAPGEDEGLMLGIVGGESPAAIGSAGSIQRMVDAGLYTPEQAQTVLKDTATGVW
jgi:quercetin dioxygenase-like cupin family protein